MAAFFPVAALKKVRQRRRWMAAPCGCSFELAMRLRRGDNDHRSGLARTRRWVRHRTRRGTWGGTRRRGTVHDGRVAVMMIVVVMMMATKGGEGQGSGKQQDEEFTHGHVSFFDWVDGGICFFIGLYQLI